MSMSQRISARSAATSVAVDVRALNLVVVGLLLSGLVLILSTGAAWLHVT